VISPAWMIAARRRSPAFVRFIVFLLIFAVGHAGAADLSTDKATYAAKEPIVVTFTDPAGDPRDYITVVPAEYPANRYKQYFRLRKDRSGSFTFRGLAPGRYQARLIRGRGKTVAAARDIVVGDAGGAGAGKAADAPRLRAAKRRFVSGEKIVVDFENVPGGKHDWIAIAEPKARPQRHLQMTYLKGEATGSHSFAPLPPGQYELRLFLRGGHTIVATDRFEVVAREAGGSGTDGGGIVLRTRKKVYGAKETIEVEFANLPIAKRNIIKITKQDAPPGTRAQGRHTKERISGTETFRKHSPGQYEVRLIADKTKEILASHSFSVSLLSRLVEPGGSAGQLGAAADVAAQCQVMVGWYRRAVEAFPGINFRQRRSYDMAAHLFRDDVFEPVFGRPFEGLDAASRKQIIDMDWWCSRNLSKEDWSVYSDFIHLRRKAFASDDSAFIIDRVVGARAALAWVDTAVREAETLPPVPESLARLDGLAEEGAGHFRHLWPSDVRKIKDDLRRRSSALAYETAMAGIAAAANDQAALDAIDALLALAANRLVDADTGRMADLKTLGDAKRFDIVETMVRALPTDQSSLADLSAALAILTAKDLQETDWDRFQAVEVAVLERAQGIYVAAIEETPLALSALQNVGDLLGGAQDYEPPLSPEGLDRVEAVADSRRSDILLAALADLPIDVSSLERITAVLVTAGAYDFETRRPDAHSELESRARALIGASYRRAISGTAMTRAGLSDVDDLLAAAKSTTPALSQAVHQDLADKAADHRFATYKTILATLPETVAATTTLDALEQDLAAFPFPTGRQSESAAVRADLTAKRQATYRTVLRHEEQALADFDGTFRGLSFLHARRVEILALAGAVLPRSDLKRYAAAAEARAAAIRDMSLVAYGQALDGLPMTLAAIGQADDHFQAIKTAIATVPVETVGSVEARAEQDLNRFLGRLLDALRRDVEQTDGGWRRAAGKVEQAGRIETAFRSTALSGAAAELASDARAEAARTVNRDRTTFAETLQEFAASWPGVAKLDAMQRDLQTQAETLPALAAYEPIVADQRESMIRAIADDGRHQLAQAGETLKHIDTVIQLGDRLGAPFEQDGQADRAAEMKTLAHQRVEALLAANLQAQEERWRRLEPSWAHVQQLRDQAKRYRGQTAAFAGWSAYAGGADAQAQTMDSGLCDQALSKARIDSSIRSSSLLGPDGALSLRDFACGLNKHGHSVTALAPQKATAESSAAFVLKVLQADQVYAHLDLRLLEALPGKTLLVGVAHGDAVQQQPISLEQWKAYVAVLLAPREPNQKAVDTAFLRPKALGTTGGGGLSAGIGRKGIVERLKKSVVFIAIIANNKFVGHGTGFFIGPRHVLTNDHVVDGATALIIASENHGVGFATLLHRGKANGGKIDSAVLYSKSIVSETYIKFGQNAEEGDEITIAGFPGKAVRTGQGYHLFMDFLTSGKRPKGDFIPKTKFDFGYVQSVFVHNRTGIENLQNGVETTGGNSGSPIVDVCGQLVAQHYSGSQSQVRKDGSVDSSKYNYAISAKVLRRFLDSVGISYGISESPCGAGAR